MTDTTHKAPERIWLQLGAGDEGTHTWADHQVGWDDKGEYEPEYVRADLVQAAVAAALREAATLCAHVSNAQLFTFDLKANNPTYEEGYSNGAGVCHHEILALITPDAQAALDRVVGELQSEIDFLNAQLEAWQAMAPPPEKDLLRKRLEERRAAIRKGEE